MGNPILKPPMGDPILDILMGGTTSNASARSAILNVLMGVRPVCNIEKGSSVFNILMRGPILTP